MSQLTINPDWDAATLELQVAMADGTLKSLPEPLRFKEQDRDAALRAFKERDWATLHQLVISKYFAVP